MTIQLELLTKRERNRSERSNLKSARRYNYQKISLSITLYFLVWPFGKHYLNDVRHGPNQYIYAAKQFAIHIHRSAGKIGWGREKTKYTTALASISSVGFTHHHYHLRITSVNPKNNQILSTISVIRMRYDQLRALSVLYKLSFNFTEKCHFPFFDVDYDAEPI